MRPPHSLITCLVIGPLLLQGCELPLDPPPVQPPQQQQPQQQQPLPQQPQPLPQKPPARQAPQPQQPAPQPAPQQPAQAATKVSVLDAVTYTDLAVGPDGTRHALYQENDLTLGREQAYYRASTDGGQTWSAPVNLSAFDADRRVGFIRLAIDGAGRVYAFWKATNEWYDNPAGAVYQGTLIYRVLEGGAWSAPVQVSPEDGTYTWFPAVDPNGQLHVLWNERIDYGQIFDNPQDGGSVLQATVTGTALGPKREIYRSALIPRPGPDGMGTGVVVEGVTGLKGYVDANGVAHWVATRLDVARDTQVVVHWDGANETYLFDQNRFTSASHFFSDPPQLVLDDRGLEHVLVRDVGTEKSTLLDFPLPDGQPVVVREALDFKGFNVVTGPGGQLAAIFSVKDVYGVDSRFDLFAASYRNGAWTLSPNLTTNIAQDQFDSGKAEPGTYYIHEFHDAAFAAGAFDQAGKLNLLYLDNASTQTDIFGNLGTKMSPVGSSVKTGAFFRIN